jgi:hypothetical protein
MRTICFLAVLICTSCRNTAVSIPQNLDAKFYFWTAFDYDLEVRIHKTGELATFVVRAIAHDSLLTNVATDSLNLTTEDLRIFYARADTAFLLRLRNYSSGDMDGSGYEGWITQGNNKHHFETENVSDTVAVHQTFQHMFFSLLYRKCINTRPYVELAEQYIRERFPVTIVSKRPYIARIYSRIVVDDRDKWLSFFRTVPRLETAIIDLRYLNWIQPELSTDLVKFGARRPKLIWVVSDHGREYFGQAGIDTTKMVSSIEEVALK